MYLGEFMNCYLHPQVEAIATCGKCGVAMCKDCETNAFFRLDGGKGQALCNRCSLISAQENVDYLSNWLKKRMIKLIICTALAVVGIIAFVAMSFGSGDEESIIGGILTAIILWAIAGAIANIGNKKNNESVKSQVWDAAYKYNHPISSAIIGIIVNALFGPLCVIANWIGYLRTKSQYKKELNDLAAIQTALNA